MIAMIAAYAQNRVIGCQGKIPWKIPGEQKQFRELTDGHCIIMGRKTYEEIGHPLKNRRIYVISSTAVFAESGVQTVHTLEEALAECAGQDVFLAGGQAVYEAGMKYADVLYLTEIDLVCEGDRYFPQVDPAVFACVEETAVDGEIPYRRTTWKRLEAEGNER